MLAMMLDNILTLCGPPLSLFVPLPDQFSHFNFSNFRTHVPIFLGLTAWHNHFHLRYTVRLKDDILHKVTYGV